ncbi:ATP synthase subunit I [Anaerovorax odorimutans]|uniref:ATP synthase subunit I n=1 Tax=Anaerovorax odorimutans TaxID=109327 RepID=UPI0003FCFD87|nr:ATP synthase subunit I [Anaerovorax odorimutans]
MNEMTKLKNQIFRYGIIIALIIELCSLLFLGWNKQFAYGLLLGTVISIINFIIIEISSRNVLLSGNKWIGLIGYLVRLIIYGFTFYVSINVSKISAMGTIIGFCTLKMGIFYLYVIKTKLSKIKILK